MQCPSCRAVYSNGLEICPRCKTPASKVSSEPAPESNATATEAVAATASNSRTAAATPAAPVASTTQSSSTLIEFPGAGRASRPQWRKELSERVRAIQERRAREAEREPAEIFGPHAEQPEQPRPPAPQLGLVPQPDAPAVNPIVAAALRRIERAHHPPPMPRSRATMGGGPATAVARVAHEQIENETTPEMLVAPALKPAPVALTQTDAKAEAQPLEKIAEPAREHGLVIIQPTTAPKVEALAKTGAVVQTETAARIETRTESVASSRPQPKRTISHVIDDEYLARLDAEVPEQLPVVGTEDDRAPVLSRFAGGLIDLLVVAFASSPFAAIIELTNGNWSDPRVAASMGSIVIVVMFLYLTASTALAGRTWGMSLVSVRAVDADTGTIPTTWQCVRRAMFYMLSLVSFGLGILYALFDAEGRTAHDLLSGTAVVRD